MCSLLINENELANTDKNSANSIVYNQMDETFEVFIKKYGSKKKEQAFHIIEACVFLMFYAINEQKFRNRRKSTNSKNNFASLLTSINEDKLCRYIMILIKGKIQKQII